MITLALVGLSGGVFGILGYEAARFFGSRMRAKPAPMFPTYTGTYGDTCGVPIHELDNVDTAPIPVNVLRANVGRSR